MATAMRNHDSFTQFGVFSFLTIAFVQTMFASWLAWIASIVTCVLRRLSSDRPAEGDDRSQKCLKSPPQDFALARGDSKTFVALPDAVLAQVLGFSGPATWSSVSCASRDLNLRIWQSADMWSLTLVMLGAKLRPAEVLPIRDQVRRVWFGIDNLCGQCVGSGSVRKRSEYTGLLRDAVHACQGLQEIDGEQTTEQVVVRCVELLACFDVDDAEARLQASTLSKLVSSQTTIFTAEQCGRVSSAFTEAMELHELLNEGLFGPVDIALDDALAAPLDIDVWGEELTRLPAVRRNDSDGCGCNTDVEEALDCLISVLRKIVDNGET